MIQKELAQHIWSLGMTRQWRLCSYLYASGKGCDTGGIAKEACVLGLGEIGPKDPNFKIKTWALGF